MLKDAHMSHLSCIISKNVNRYLAFFQIRLECTIFGDFNQGRVGLLLKPCSGCELLSCWEELKIGIVENIYYLSYWKVLGYEAAERSKFLFEKILEVPQIMKGTFLTIIQETTQDTKNI